MLEYNQDHVKQTTLARYSLMVSLKQHCIFHMFAHLLDDDDDDDGDDDGPAQPPGHAAAADAGAAAAARHHRAGARHTSQTQLRMQLGHARTKLTKLRERTCSIIASSVTSFSAHVASVCFGHKQANDRAIVQLAGGGTVNVVNASHGRKTFDYKTSVRYGILSAVYGQASGLASMISHSPEQQVQHIISMNEFDDAGMWLQDPASKADRAAGLRTEGSKIAGRLWKRGSNIFLPVCNMCEQIFVRKCRSNGVEVIAAADVHSASQALCKANTGTIAHHWSKWTAIGMSGSGLGVDPERVLNDALDQNSDAWRTIICNKDNLALNRLVVGIQEKHIVDRLKSGLYDAFTSPSLLSLSCMGHSVVLACKPVVQAMDNLPSKWVRMGHLHESGKISAEHLVILKARVRDKFRFRPVSEYPIDFRAWQAKAAQILRLSRPAMDLRPEDETFIMSIDNGDWDAEFFDHWCLGASYCEVCNGDPDAAEELMVIAAELSCGVCVKPHCHIGGRAWKHLHASSTEACDNTVCGCTHIWYYSLERKHDWRNVGKMQQITML